MNKIEVDSKTENRLTAVREEGFRGLGEKGKGINNKKNPQRHRQHYGDYRREKQEVEESKEEINGDDGDGRRLDFG